MSTANAENNTSWRGPKLPAVAPVPLVGDAVYDGCRSLLHRYFRFFHDAEFRGLENVPEHGPAILAPNHVSYYDPPLVGAALRGRVRFMAWNALFANPFWDRAFRSFGAFPVDIEGGGSSAYRECLEMLRLNERIVVFPEAGRTLDGKLLPFKDGVGRLALKAGGVPIVPVAIHGAGFAWPRGEVAPRWWFKLRVHYLPPIRPRAAHGPKQTRAEAARVMEEIRASIQADLDRGA